MWTDRINLYPFYKNDSAFQTLIAEGIMNTKEGKYTSVDKIIKYIEINNETTLIGTLNFMNLCHLNKFRLF